MSALRFAVIGINHDHINGQTKCMLDAGAEFAGFYAPEDDLAAEFSQRFPGAPRVDDKRRLLEDKSIQLIVSAAILNERAPLGVEAMRHGKDFMSDKPGMVSLEQLAEVRKVQAETKRIYSICFSRAPRAARHGEGGRTRPCRPHRPRGPDRRARPAPHPQAAAPGVVLRPQALWRHPHRHRLAPVRAVPVLHGCRRRADPVRHGRQPRQSRQARPAGFRRCPPAHRQHTGYIRVDWYTPDGLPVWGDGRLTILGTEGYIELRKYCDIGGRPGADHLFVVDGKGVEHIDCSNVELPYGRQLMADVLNRTETAMTQARTFKSMELALTAQAMAEKAGPIVPAR